MWCRVVTMVLAVGSVVVADAPIEIKIRKVGKGDFSLMSYEEKTINSIIISTTDGKVLEKNNEEFVESAKFKEEILDKEEGKRPSKVRRTYDSAKFTANGKETVLPYSGKAVNIQRLSKSYAFAFDDGKALTADQLGTLPKEFTMERTNDDNMQKFILPGKPVAVGGTWTVDSKVVLAELVGAGVTTTFDLTKATGNGKLTKAYDKNGKKFGALEIEISAPLKELPGSGQKDGPGLKCEAGSKFQLKASLEGCIDGSSSTATLVGELKFSGTTRIPAVGKDVERVMKFEMSSMRTDSHEQIK